VVASSATSPKLPPALAPSSNSHTASPPIFRWPAIESIAPKIGCTAETLRNWVRRYERDTGQCDGMTTAEATRIKELERENRELKKANEILRLASAFFAQAELDRRFKP
jgi:transposase-like protein